MLCAKATTLTFFVMLLSPLKPKSCAGHNSYTVRDNWVIFGRKVLSRIISCLLNYKAYNHQTLQSASSQCTDSTDTMTW